MVMEGDTKQCDNGNHMDKEWDDNRDKAIPDEAFLKFVCIWSGTEDFCARLTERRILQRVLTIIFDCVTSQQSAMRHGRAIRMLSSRLVRCEAGRGTICGLRLMRGAPIILGTTLWLWMRPSAVNSVRCMQAARFAIAPSDTEWAQFQNRLLALYSGVHGKGGRHIARSVEDAKEFQTVTSADLLFILGITSWDAPVTVTWEECATRLLALGGLWSGNQTVKADGSAEWDAGLRQQLESCHR